MFLVTLQSLHFSDMIATAFLHILQCSFALPALGFYHYHYSKTFSPKRFMISDSILDGIFLQSEKYTISNICHTIWDIDAFE